MSILIKGMEMPKHDDEYVIFTVYGDGGVVYGPLNRPHVRYKNRAIPVPNHGRLIDADALQAECVPEPTFVAEMLFRKVSNAPTIIPADRED